MTDQSISTTPAGTPMPEYVSSKVKAGHTMTGDDQTQTSASRWVCSKPACRKFVATYPPVPTETPGGVWGPATQQDCTAP